MHHLITGPYSPQGRRTHHVPRGLTAVLNDSIARPNIVQQEVAEWVDCLIAQNCRDCKRTAINKRTCGSGSNCSNVTDVARGYSEELLTDENGSINRTTARGSCRSHEIGEGLHIVAIVFRLCN